MPAHRTEYDDVPAAAAEVDPHWLELQSGAVLPTSYLPVTMSGPQPHWRLVAAWVLIAMLVATTAGGICLTYGPAELFRLVDGAR